MDELVRMQELYNQIEAPELSFEEFCVQQMQLDTIKFLDDITSWEGTEERFWA